MRKKVLSSIFLVLVVFSLVTLLVRFGSKPFYSLLGYQQKAGIKVTSLPEAEVSINGEVVGKTPYQDETLLPGDYQLKISDGDRFWQGNIKLTEGTISVVNRELNQTGSLAGESLVLYPGTGIVVSSTPVGAEVKVDDKNFGRTPITSNDVSTGEHNIIISHPGYISRSIRASLPEGMQLVISVELAASESDRLQLTLPTITPSPKVVVLDTPTGFLRVRDKPSLNGVEIGRINTGEVIDLIEETSTGWYKIKMKDGKDGYVSSTYVSKK